MGLRYPTNLLPEVKAVLEAAKIQDVANNKNNGAVESKGVVRVRNVSPRLAANHSEPQRESTLRTHT